MDRESSDGREDKLEDARSFEGSGEESLLRTYGSSGLSECTAAHASLMLTVSMHSMSSRCIHCGRDCIRVTSASFCEGNEVVI